ncbi:hypothetical protein RJ639_023286, partial [Escallonia herrerae]
MGGDEEWRKMADTHKMSPEEVKRAGVEASKRAPGHDPGGVLHQRRNVPLRLSTMALGGFAIVAALGYFTLYVKKKPDATAGDVAKVAAGVAGPEETRPRDYSEDPRHRKYVKLATGRTVAVPRVGLKVGLDGTALQNPVLQHP